MQYKEIATIDMVVKNNGKSPRGVNTTSGVVIVPAGASSRKITVTEGEAAGLEASGFSVEVIGNGEPVLKKTETVRRTKIGEEVMALRAEVMDLRSRLSSSASSTATVASTDSSSASDETSSQGDVKTADDLLAMAEDKSVPFAAFKAAAYKLLGDSMPNKKDDIINALLEKSYK